MHAVERAVFAAVVSLAGLDGLAGQAAQHLAEDRGGAPIKGLALAHELGHQLDGQFHGQLEELHVDRVGDAGIIQRAVGGRQEDAHRLAQRAQVVAAGGGQQHRGQFVGIQRLH